MTETGYYLGIDLGGTTTTLVLVSEEGRLRGQRTFATEARRGAEAIIRTIAAQSRSLWQEAAPPGGRLVAAGIGSPGPVDPASGVVVRSANLGWEKVALRRSLEERLERPVRLENDAVAATFGEGWLGAGRPYRDLVGITLGTGVGGGILIGGRIHHGFLGTAGHLGHMIIHQGGRPCPCGNRGCLEAYVSAPAIVARTREALQAGTASRLGRPHGPLSAKSVFEAALEGDALALEIFRETARFLAAGIHSLLNILNPQAVVIMGGVAGAGEILFGPLGEHLKQLDHPRIFNTTALLPGELGKLSGALGAAALAARKDRDALPGSMV